jgi:hypothetical protein
MQIVLVGGVFQVNSHMLTDLFLESALSWFERRKFLLNGMFEKFLVLTIGWWIFSGVVVNLV